MNSEMPQATPNTSSGRKRNRAKRFLVRLSTTPKAPLAQRTFNLTGDSWHRFVLPLSAGGRKLLSERGKLRSLLIASIPGGQRTAGVPLEAPAPRR